ncbi:uncharacterized protein LOC120333875 [Styela clava]
MKLFAILTCLVAFASATYDPDYESTKMFLMSSKPEDVQDMIKKLEANGNELPKNVKRVIEEHPELLPPQAPASTSEHLLVFEGSEKLSKRKLTTITRKVEGLRKKQEESKKTFVPKKITPKRKGKACNVDDDCPYMHYCEDVADRLKENLDAHNSSEYFNFTKQRLDITTKECVKRIDEFMRTNGARNIPNVYKTHNSVVSVLQKVGARKEKGLQNYATTFKFVQTYNITSNMVEPMARHGDMSYEGGTGEMDPSLLMIMLMSGLLGNGGGDDDDQFETFLMMSMMGGGGGNMMNNPFLMLSLLDGEGGLGGGDDLMMMIMLTQMGGVGGANTGMLPLYISMLTKDDNGDEDDDSLKSLLPLILSGSLGGGKCHGGSDGGMGGLMQYLLYSSLFDELDSNLMLIILLGGNGCGSGGGDIMQMILLLNAFDDDGEGSLGGLGALPLMMILGGMGSGSGKMDPSILILALSGGMEISELMPFLIFSDPRYANSPLPMLLLLGGDLLGGDIDPILMMALLFSGGDSGYTGNQVYTHQAVQVNSQYQDIPPAAGSQYAGGSWTVSGSGGQSHSSSGGGMFGGLLSGKGSGGGIFEFFMFMKLFDTEGEGNDDILPLLLMMTLLGGGGGFGGSQDHGHHHYQDPTHYGYQQGAQVAPQGYLAITGQAQQHQGGYPQVTQG